MFAPSDLELVLCGTLDLDLSLLRAHATYDGYESTEPVVGWFWEVVQGFSEDEKKRLLAFATGTDRVPIGGLASTKFCIAKQGPDSDRLPTAHTCFNVLLLPAYSSKEKLDRLLRIAILHAEGFGMR